MVSKQLNMRILFFSLVFMALANVSGAAESLILSQEEWSQPKKVESVLQMPAIRQALTAMAKSPNSQLIVLYPGGDEGTLWAHELKAWLVSLGLSSHQIDLRPGSRQSSGLEMQVVLPISAKIGQN